MSDCQIVLRFFALQNDEHIRGSMKSILDNCMKRNATASKDNLRTFEHQFIEAIHACDQLFDGHPFLLPPDEKGRQRISIGLYDSCMVAVFRSRQRLDELLRNRDEVNRRISEVIGENIELLTGKANTAQSIRDRISAIEGVIAQI